MNSLPMFYNEPEENPGKWQTQCQCCEWKSEDTVPYQNECEVAVCPECGSDDVIDNNIQGEE